MLEGQPKPTGSDKKVLSPLDKINNGVLRLAHFAEVSAEEYESLRRYANLIYRINQISFDFNFDYATKKTYTVGVKGEEGKFAIQRENYRDFRQMLKSQVADLRETAFDNNPKLNHLRRQVAVIVNDNKPTL